MGEYYDRQQQQLRQAEEARERETDIPDRNPEYVYHVYSGLDAFAIRKNGKIIAYAPYVAVIAIDDQEAREKAALMVDQVLEGQEKNPAYDNFIAEAVRIYKFNDC